MPHVVLITKRTKRKHLHSQRTKHPLCNAFSSGPATLYHLTLPAPPSQHAAGLCKDVHTYFNVNTGTRKKHLPQEKNKTAKYPLLVNYPILPVPVQLHQHGPILRMPTRGYHHIPSWLLWIFWRTFASLLFSWNCAMEHPCIFSLQLVAVLHGKSPSQTHACLWVWEWVSVHAYTLPVNTRQKALFGAKEACIVMVF